MSLRRNALIFVRLVYHAFKRFIKDQQFRLRPTLRPAPLSASPLRKIMRKAIARWVMVQPWSMASTRCVSHRVKAKVEGANRDIIEDWDR